MPAFTEHSLLGDALIAVVDDIRGSLRAALGTRPYTVARVVRTWSGGRVGEGTPLDDVLELQPPPMVRLDERGRFAPGGQEYDGDIILTEVSLRYTALDLVPALEQGQECAYRVREAHGQEQNDRFYTVTGQPFARRGDQDDDRTDWRVTLRRIATWTTHDGANAGGL